MDKRLSYEDSKAATLLNPDVPQDAKIWRYLDLGKFLDLMQTSGLYFSRIDLLEDKLEGSPTAIEVSSVEAFQKDFPDPRGLNALERARIARRWVLVSCWHENEGESRAMWKLYGREDNTVAIVSTPLRLARTAIIGSGEYIYSIVSKVHYIDHWKDDCKAIANAKAVAPFVHKDHAYAYENEIRALLCEQNWLECDPDIKPQNGGVHIPVLLPDLITEIVLPPNSPKYIEEVVKWVAKNSSNIGIPVVRSRLERPGILG